MRTIWLKNPCLLYTSDLFHAHSVAAALEFSRKEGADNLLVHVELNETTGKRDDVRIVVLTAQFGKLHVDDVRSTAANDFVSRERHADARAAYEHAAIGHAVGRCV